MNWERLRLKFFDLFRRRRLHEELDEEIRAHLAIDVAQRIAEGDSPEQARRAALRDVRSVEMVKENTRDAWTWNWLDDAWRDLGYASRSLLRSMGFAIGAFLILSLGIGVNLGAFQLLDKMFLQEPQIPDPQSLVRFVWRSQRAGDGRFPFPLTQFVTANANFLSAVVVRVDAAAVGGVAWGDEAKDQPRASFVSPNWFTELDYRPELGRVLQAGIDDAPDAAPVVVITRSVWERRLNRDPNVIGRTVKINNRSATIIGVAPPSIIPQWTDSTVWLPVSQIDYFVPGSVFKTSWDSRMGRTELFGRLRPGVSLTAAREASRAVMTEAANQHPDQVAKGAWLEPYSAGTYFRGPDIRRRDILYFVSTGASLSLLILFVACANLSNLILSRTLGRMRELSIRTALGASRWRIVRHLMSESILLVAFGSVAGLALVYWSSRILAANWETAPDFTPDLRTVFAALGVAGLTIAAVGLLPALKVGHSDLTNAIKDGGSQASARLSHARLRRALLAGQLGASCVLLVLTGLMLRSFERARFDRGFDVQNVGMLSASLENYGIAGRDGLVFWNGLRAELAAHPEIESIALVSRPPFADPFTLSLSDAPGVRIALNEVDPDFFAVLHIPILAGRTFSPSDDIGATAIISRSLAIAMYGTVDVVGKGFPKSAPQRTIIGVAGDARLAKLQEEQAAFYALPDPNRFDRVLIARTRTDAGRLFAMMRETARNYDPRVTANARLLADDFANFSAESRAMSLLLAVLGGIALSITCLGVFGMVSYVTLSRRKEIGIRIALGGNRRSVTLTLIRHVTWPLVFGILLGLMAAFPFGSMFGGAPLYVRPFDLTVWTIVAVVLVGVAGIAAAWPAWRATKVDVLQSLRWE